MAVGIVSLILLVIFGLLLAVGVGWIAVVPLAFVLFAVVWMGVQFALGRTPARATREARRPELLGPGGPDDPDRGA